MKIETRFTLQRCQFVLSLCQLAGNRKIMPLRNKAFPAKPEVETSSYRGPDRRGCDADNVRSGEAAFDDKGNSVWKLRTHPRRREDDDTAKLMAPLDVDSLSLLDEETAPEGYDPYSRND